MAKEADRLFSKEGYALMAAAFEVHNVNGGGLLEEVYQESMEIELGLRGISFKAKQELAVFYKGRELRKRYIPDLFAYGGIVIEIKACLQIAPEHQAQLLNYMRITNTKVGYLINFGPILELEWKRFVL